jgi:fibronectin type 3 domain-containing protein
MFNKTPSPPRSKMVALLSALVLGLAMPASTAVSVRAAATATLDPSATRFLELWNKIHDPANGYFSPEGAPYHSVETLLCEAPDHGHETTSEAYSYWLWLEAMYGKITGDWSYFRKAWTTMEAQIIPGAADQPNAGAYGGNKPATYAAEWSLPSYYPSQLRTDVPVGQDPVSSELTSTYGDSYVYGMHWLLDCDNFYGFGNHGDGVSKPSYINTFQRGEQESVWETVPQPSWEAFNWGGSYGFLDLFVKELSTPARQWKYTNAPDADARAIQALYWAMVWVKEQGKDPSVELPLAQGSKMGDYLRLAMFDKYFKPIGIQSEAGRGGTGYESAHYLMSWYYAWGGPTPPGSGWAWRIGCSHSHFGYQNPLTAWALSSVPELTPKSPSAAADWKKSLDRQLELYQWLQSAEGAIAGGATNSYNGNYSPYPAGTPTFYEMAYQEAPVYHDPPSNQWFGMQAWSMERLAEYYYQTNNARAKSVLDKWVPWVKSQVSLTADGSYAIPSELAWTGQPETWVPAAPVANTNLHVAVKSTTQDVGVTGSLVKALLYYSAATSKWTTAPDDASRSLGKALLDRMWSFSDSKGIATVEKRGDYTRFFDPVYIPSGWSGKMPNGDAISSGVRFIDIRSNYLKDPEYAAMKAAVDAGVDYQTTYHRFWAQADIATAYGVYSNLFESTSTVPATPTGLSATAGDANVALSWTASTGATSYNVYCGTTAGGEAATPIATGLTSASYINTGLTNGTTYYYKVAAVNTAGTSALSDEVSATPKAAVVIPAVPTGLAATAGDAKVTLTWSASTGATSYNVYCGTTAGGEAATPIATGLTSASYINTGLTNGTTYYYKVAAVNAAGTSALSTEANATPTANTTGPVTANAAQTSSSGPWWGENDLTLTNTGAVTAMTVTLTVQKTTGVSYNGQYNTTGQFSQTHSETASTIVYTFTLNAGQTFGSGSNIFAAQYGGTGTAHAATGDTYSISYSADGKAYTLNGHF